MSVGREDAASKPDELQTGSSWIPATPVKPVCTNLEEKERLAATNQIAQENLSKQGDFLQQSQIAPACYASMSLHNGSKVTNNWNSGKTTDVYKENMISFENWLAGDAANNSNVLGKDPSSYTNFSVNGPEQWGYITFGNLLMKKVAMENALAQRCAASIASSSSSCGISAPCFPAQDESSQFTIGSGNVSPQNQRHTLLGANFDAETRIPKTVTGDRSSILSRQFLDVYPPPKTITDADSRKNTQYQFEPITSDKTNRGGQLEAAAKNSSIDEDHTGEKSEIIRNGVMQLHKKKEKPPLVKDQLYEVTTTQLQENHKPGKGGTEEADLLKTSQQKTRRRKHMPEVITEGKKKKTPKSSEQKTTVPQDTTRVKGKYVQKSGVNSPLNGEKESSVENFSTKDESETAQNPQNPLPPTNKDPPKQNHMASDQTVSTRGKCQLVFSDVTHDKESYTCQVSIDPDGHWKRSSTNDSISSGTCLKRQNMNKTVEGVALCNRSMCSNGDGKDTEQTIGKSDSCLLSTSEEEPTAGVKVKPNWLTSSTSFAKLLQMTNTVLHGVYGEGSNKRKPDQRQYVPSESVS